MRTTQTPEFRHGRTILLAGTMSIYNSQDDVTAGVPAQWQDLLARPVPEIHPGGEAVWCLALHE